MTVSAYRAAGPMPVQGAGAAPGAGPVPGSTVDAALAAAQAAGPGSAIVTGAASAPSAAAMPSAAAAPAGISPTGGGWNAGWEQRFRALFAELQVPPMFQEQAIAGISSRGLDDQQLQQFYDQIASQRPAWGPQWEQRFTALGLPEELVAELRGSGMPAEHLEQTFTKLQQTKLEYEQNGRMARLDKVKATDAEKWGVMLSAPESDKKFQKAVDRIQSSKVPLWKRVTSIGVHFIPGVGTLNYIAGKDLITGERIDRTNPLNIGMAVLSAIPVIGYARGAAQALKGASMLTATLQSGAAAGAGASAAAGAAGAAGAGAAGAQATLAGGAAVGKIAGDSASIARMLTSLTPAAGAADAGAKSAQTAATLAKFQAGLTTVDKAKMVLPVVNRFGEARNLYQVSTGFYQANQFATRMGTQLARLATAPQGEKLIAELPKLAQLDEATLAATAAGNGTGAQTAARQLRQIEEIRRITGMSPSQVQNVTGQLVPALQGQGTVFRGSSAYWRFNPFKNQATVQVQGAAAGEVSRLGQIRHALTGSGAAPDVATVRLGRGVNAASDAGFAQVAGALDAAASGGRLSQAASTAQIGQGVGIQAAAGGRGVAQAARGLVLPGSREAVVRNIADAQHATNNLYGFGRFASDRVVRLAGQSATFAGIGVVTGQAGTMTQPMWDAYLEGRGAGAAAQPPASTTAPAVGGPPVTARSSGPPVAAPPGGSMNGQAYQGMAQALAAR